MRGVAPDKAIKAGYGRYGTSSQGGLSGSHPAVLLASSGFIPGMKEERLREGCYCELGLASVVDGRGLTYCWLKTLRFLLFFKLIEEQAKG